jgi:peptidyl-dipeptidase Dcp
MHVSTARARVASLLFATAVGVGATMTPLPSALGPDNPFSKESTLPYKLPPLDKIQNQHFEPGLEAGMAEQRAEIDAIKANKEIASFDNTIVAMEKSGQLLARVSTVFFNLSSSNTNEEIERVQTAMAPKLSAHQDAIYLDSALFARVKKLYDQRDSLKLDAEAKRLLERYHTNFVRAGANLNDAQKQELKKLNEQISSLTTKFRQTVLEGDNARAVIVDKESELEGLTKEQIATAAETAKSMAAAAAKDGKAEKAKAMEGKWVIKLLNTTGQPLLSSLKNRALRERLYDASVNRGWSGEFDTTGLIAEIVKLRADRAKLLGYKNHAAYVIEDETALTPEAANKMLGQLAPAAVANAKREAADMQKLIDEQAKATGKPGFKLEPWDWDFYAEQVRQQKYAFDEQQVRPYFEMNRVLVDGVLFAATKLYGITFKERKDLPTYQPDVKVFEVFNPDGSQLGLFLVDWYARPNKRGGAWMNTFVDQSKLFGTKSIVTNNLNIPKPPAGQPTLLTFDEVNTAFHEFGHAAHGLFSNIQYPTFSGTSVPRDFVEYPSQYNEMWATEPTVLANYAKHHQTGDAMPKELLEKVLAARKFNQGFATTEYLAAAMLDQAWHQLEAGKTPSKEQVKDFETKALKAAGMDFYAVPPRYRSTYFLHIFSSPIGYSAGYYAYIWSEVLARDTEAWMNAHGGLKRENGDILRAKVLSRGFSVDALSMFRDFYGKEPEIGPLLEARGLDVGGQAKLD